MTTYFADGIGNIAVQGNLVRIEFVTIALPQQGQEGIKTEASHYLVMPLDGFLKGLVVQEQIRGSLIAEGIVKVHEKPSNDELSGKSSKG